MDAAAILSDVRLVLNAAVLVGNTIAEAYSYFEKARGIANGTIVLTDDERAAMRSRQSALEDDILAADPDA